MEILSDKSNSKENNQTFKVNSVLSEHAIKP